MTGSVLRREPPRRADARRNYEAILAAAREAFTQDAPPTLEDVARTAGVGIGTLYRNFPDRSALLEAVYLDEVQTLCDVGRDLAAARPPWEALAGWLHRYVQYLATKRSLAEELRSAFGAGNPVFASCRTAITEAGDPLLRAAQSAGDARADVGIDDVVRLVSSISTGSYSTPDQLDRVLGMAIDGLRAR
ncbi:TetR/AcrR family transcriptional regulator [Kineococcus rhizosphaerae]|uniref:TetR family transcriptional regulator n=1 Tax=Kineococcus rhizosphaerae TaxID=559628 RepID=A0A2T0R6Y9_9ACTN|nr:TetR/AcrR family transcriptional regulator [Kineococcus rhizosphaerae]PRY16890.1 TetR family transcriptional regulator [Kineococcus rhizosphaerae]